MATYLVTGANKRIGLQVCTQLAARGDEVIAVCRSSSAELDDLGIRIIEGVDISKAEAVAQLKSELWDQKLDVLLNNAGILHGDSFGNLDYEDMVLQFRVNSLVLACMRRGLRVPQDLAVTGFGDFEHAPLLSPSLTTVRVPARAIGECAADLLLRKMSGQRVETNEVDVGYELVIRESS